MRFPLVLYTTVVKYLIQQRMKGRKRFPLVTMLEPTLRCNLDCIGCGRIEEYHREKPKDLTVDECLKAVDDCGAPIVSVCGGEPLVYKPVDELIQELIKRKKYIYLCTNAMFMDRYWDRIPPHDRLSLSIHLDGLEETHDWAVDQPGVFKKVAEIIDEAKARGYRVSTNTTVFNGTNADEIVDMMQYLYQKGVDGMLISGAYPQEGDKGKAGLRRQQMEEVFQKIFSDNKRVSKYKFNNSPIYTDFLQGKRELACSPFASPNMTVKGWQGPCYVLREKYYDTFDELMENTDWDNLGPGKDPRCTDCKMHSGFEPTVTIGEGVTLKDQMRVVAWSLFG